MSMFVHVCVDIHHGVIPSCLSGEAYIGQYCNQSGCHYRASHPYCPLMGFIKIGADQYWWVGEGVGGRGILYFIKMISPPVCSSGRRVFIHKVHPFTHANQHISQRDAEETAEPMRQYWGEITAGHLSSFFHLKTL